MKKILAVTLAAVLSLSLAACSNSSDSSGGISVGDYVEFGKYNWEVLEIKGRDALVLSERILEHRPYHSEYTVVTWEESDIRAYLNSDFLNNNFSEDEVKQLKLVKVENADNPWDFSEQGGNYKTIGGEDTEDKIFLLSLEEAVKYMGNDKYDMLSQEELGKTETKLYDGMSGVRVAYNQYGMIASLVSDGSSENWLLRSPGSYSNTAAFVNYSGDICIDGHEVDDGSFGIRPAMWIKNVRTLKKSIVECTDPDCKQCNTGMYTDTPSPDAPDCIICQVGGECKDKVRHNRLYHQWKYGKNSDQSPEKLETANSLKDIYTAELNELRTLVCNAAQMQTDDGRMRKTRIIGEVMYEKLSNKFSTDSIYFREYYAYDDNRLDDEIEFLNGQIEILKKAITALNSAVIKADLEAPTFEEDRLDMFEALGIEGVREGLKRSTDDEDVKDDIDSILGENKVYERLEFGDKEGTMDAYFQQLFFSE